MRYLIDGYNLIGHHPDIQFTTQDKETKLVEQLTTLANRITIVFDNQTDHPYPSKYVLKNVTVIGTSAGESADDYMCEWVRPKQHKDSLFAVTSDRDLTYRLKRERIQVMPCAAFLKLLTPRHSSPEKPEESHPMEIDWWMDQFES